MAEKRQFINSESFDYDENNELTSSFSNNYDNYEMQYNTFYEGLYDEKEVYIPVTAFSSKLGCLQAIVKYLKEKKDLKLSEIAALTNRDQRTIWNVYNQAKSATIEDVETDILIPLSIIRNRTFSVLQNIILHLRHRSFSYTEIAVLLERNYQTIYTTHRKTKGGME